MQFGSCGDADVFCLVSVIVGGRVDMPDVVFVGSTDEGVGTKAVESYFQRIAGMVLRMKRKAAEKTTADAVFRSTGSKRGNAHR